MAGFASRQGPVKLPPGGGFTGGGIPSAATAGSNMDPNSAAHRELADRLAGGTDARLAYQKRQEDYWKSIGQGGTFNEFRNITFPSAPSAPSAAAPVTPTLAPTPVAAGPTVAGGGPSGAKVVSPEPMLGGLAAAGGGGGFEDAGPGAMLSGPNIFRQGIGTRHMPNLAATLAGLRLAY